jgi:hypothetical protein
VLKIQKERPFIDWGTITCCWSCQWHHQRQPHKQTFAAPSIHCQLRKPSNESYNIVRIATLSKNRQNWSNIDRVVLTTCPSCHWNHHCRVFPSKKQRSLFGSLAKNGFSNEYRASTL